MLIFNFRGLIIFLTKVQQLLLLITNSQCPHLWTPIKTTRLDFAKNKAKEIISQKKIGHTFFLSTTSYIDNKPKKFNSNKAALEFVDKINVNNSFYEFDAYRIPNNIDSSQVIFISDGLLHDINLKNYLFIDVH